MTTGWSLRRRVTALCVVVGLVITALAIGATVVAAANRSHLNALVTKTGPLRSDGEALLTALINQETGVRGYALTGERRDLVPYEAGVREEAKLVARMDARLREHPEIRRQLETVRVGAGQWRAEFAQPVIAATTEDPSSGRALLTEAASQRFEELRGSMNALQDSIIELRDQTAADARDTGNELVVMLIIAALVILLAGYILVTSLNRLVIGPVTTLAQQVREISEGDYQREITKVGPPELAQLAGDIDGMRRRIASDLAEVREARSSIEWVNSQLQKQTEELVRSNRDLEQFAYVASHDLQEPLRKVASFCQLLQRRYAGQLDERADQYIAFAVDGAQRMQRLINDLLAFSRIGRLTSGFTEVDLNKVMGDVASQTEAARQYADGELTWSGLPVIRGEEPLLTNLLVNLVSNSLKFRRPDVLPRVHISARRVDDEWEITCQDNGIGIEPEFADKIFVIFQRLHSKDAYPGTGIGLAIVKKIVEYHGGRVWVDPEVTEGTAIRFTLPAMAEPPSEAPEAENDEAGSVDAAEGSTGPADARPAADDAGPVVPAGRSDPDPVPADRSGVGTVPADDSGPVPVDEPGTGPASGPGTSDEGTKESVS